MTTYSHTITFRNNEWIALMTLVHGTIDPNSELFGGDLKSAAQRVRNAMKTRKSQMTSTSSSCWPDGKIPPDAFEPRDNGDKEQDNDRQIFSSPELDKRIKWLMKNGPCE